MVNFKEARQNLGLLIQSNIKLTYIEDEYPDLTGKVFVVTGGPTGIGFEVSRLLAQKNAKVWMVARSQAKIDAAIEKIKGEFPNAILEYFKVDFSDLETIKPGVQKFLESETRLDGVIHNAGVMTPPDGSKTTQNFELQLGVNNIGPHLLQKFLDPMLIETAKKSPPNSVRLLWVSSVGHSLFSVKGGIDWNDINHAQPKKPFTKYGQSKSINVYQSIQWPKQHPNSGVVSLTCHPGNLKSELQRHSEPGLAMKFAEMMLSPTKYGAYTELFAMLNPNLTTKDNGAYIIPWGRVGVARKDVVDGANGPAGQKLWFWLDEKVKQYE